MVEPLSFIAFWKRLPIELCSLKKRKRSHHIGTGKSERIFDRPVDVGLSCKMDNTIYLLVLHQFVKCIEVADIHLYELVVRPILDILEVGEVTCIGLLIQIDNLIIRILIYEQPNYVAADKSCATGDNYILHSKNLYYLNS